MKKDDALALRERLRTTAEQAAKRLGVAGLEDDGKLYFDEVGDTVRWAQRLSVPSRWPHQAVGAGTPACPGLRFEIWYFGGKAKDEQLWLLALCDGDRGLDGLQAHLAATFKQLVEGGKYARRYKPIDARIQAFYPQATGVVRPVPIQIAKAEAAVAQLLEDALRLLDQAVADWDPSGEAPARHQAACAAYDPLAALKAKFGQ